MPTRVVDVEPCSCGRCGSALPGDGLDPAWRQVVEPPRIRPNVAGYRMHALTCDRCGATAAETPPGAAREYGPSLRATPSMPSGGHRPGKRSAQALAGDPLGPEVGTGRVCDPGRQTARALEPVAAEAREYARKHPANVDETGRKQGRAKAWLRVAVARRVTAFAIAWSRRRGAFEGPIGPSYRWVATPDRYSASR